MPPEPPLLGRLPDQYFTRILAVAAAARAQPGPRFIDLGRGNPDLPPPAHAVAARRAAAADAAARAGVAGPGRRPRAPPRPRPPAVPGRAVAARGDRRALRRRPRRDARS